MSNIKKYPLSVFVSIVAMSGMLNHAIHIEHLAELTHSTKFVSSAKENKLSTGGHTHIESDSYGNSTFSSRSQPPAGRPQDDDDKDNVAKKRTIADGFGFGGSSLMA